MSRIKPGTCGMCRQRPVATFQLRGGEVPFAVCAACDQTPAAQRAHAALDGYDIREGCIHSPGKFEGERRYVPYFWSVFLDGGADDDGRVVSIPLEDDDRALFPELARRHRVRLVEDEAGFVCEMR
jgi:hypothetical protein